MKSVKLKIGDKVCLVKDGIMGEHHKVMYSKYIDEMWEIIKIEEGHYEIKFRDYYSIWVSIFQIERYLNQDHLFSKIKKGDWVECKKGNGSIVHREVSNVLSNVFEIGTKEDGYVFQYDFKGNCTTLLKGYKLIRILLPKEVIVDFGNGIKGTIERDAKLVVVKKEGFNIAWILISSLSDTMLKKVESILASQKNLKV